MKNLKKDDICLFITSREKNIQIYLKVIQFLFKK